MLERQEAEGRKGEEPLRDDADEIGLLGLAYDRLNILRFYARYHLFALGRGEYSLAWRLRKGFGLQTLKKLALAQQQETQK